MFFVSPAPCPNPPSRTELETSPLNAEIEQTADLREELALAQGRAKEAQAAMERCRADLLRLEDGQARAQAALDAKNLEASHGREGGMG